MEHEELLRDAEDLRRLLVCMRYDAAAARFKSALCDFGGEVKKHYNPNQPRLSAGQPGAGRWAQQGTTASAVRAAAKVTARAVLANPEAAAAAGSAALPLIAGALGDFARRWPQHGAS